MKKRNTTRKKGFTLFEMLTAIAVLALLGVMITVGTNLATKSMSKSMYIANSSLLSDTVNKAMTDVLRYSVPTDGQNFAEPNNVKFSCDLYTVDDGYFFVGNDGLIRLNFGKTKIHTVDDETGEKIEREKQAALIINDGMYAGLKIDNLQITYGADEEGKTDKVYTVSYDIVSEELGLTKEGCSFTVKPFDIDYKNAGSYDILDWDDTTDFHIHTFEKWNWVNNDTCCSTCSNCSKTIYREHLLSDEDLSTVEAEREKLTKCNSSYSGTFTCVNCGKPFDINVTSESLHSWIKEDDPSDNDFHIIRCVVCGEERTVLHSYTLVNHDNDNHTLKCSVCDHLFTEKHSISDNTQTLITAFETELPCGNEPVKYEFPCYCSREECSQPIDVYRKPTNTEHLVTKWKITKGKEGIHTGKCSLCQTDITGPHEFYEIKAISNVNHGKYCICEQLISEEQHSKTGFELKPYINNDAYHVQTCKGCGYQKADDLVDILDRIKDIDFLGLLDSFKHNIQYPQENMTQDTHKKYCPDCGYEKTEPHQFKWTMIKDEYHAEICTVCGYEKEGSREKHPETKLTLSIKYNLVADKNVHNVKCSICNGTFKRKHDKKEEQYTGKDSNTYHKIVCACGQEFGKEKHEGKWGTPTKITGNDTQHQYTCKCGMTKNENHEFTFEKIDGNNTVHNVFCKLCDYSTEKEHKWVSAHNETTHYEQCSDCGMKRNETPHTLEESYSTSDSQHWKKCTVCEYKASLGNHTFSKWAEVDSSNHSRTCSVCNKPETKPHNFNKNRQYIKSLKKYAYATCGDCGYSRN